MIEPNIDIGFEPWLNRIIVGPSTNLSYFIIDYVIKKMTERFIGFPMNDMMKYAIQHDTMLLLNSLIHDGSIRYDIITAKWEVDRFLPNSNAKEYYPFYLRKAIIHFEKI